MIVLYFRANNQFIQAIKGFPELEERDNKLYFKDGKVILNDLTKAGYKEYPDQLFERPTEWNETTEAMEELPITLSELKLRDFMPEELEDREKPDMKTRVDALEAKVKILETRRIK